MKWYVRAWKRSFDFAGRARCREFWFFMLIHVVVATVLKELDGAFLGELLGRDFGLLNSTYVSVGMLPAIAVTVRRLHDIDCSAWWMLLALVPCGVLGLLPLLISNSQRDSNRYGPNPKDSDPGSSQDALASFPN